MTKTQKQAFFWLVVFPIVLVGALVLAAYLIGKHNDENKAVAEEHSESEDIVDFIHKIPFQPKPSYVIRVEGKAESITIRFDNGEPHISTLPMTMYTDSDRDFIFTAESNDGQPLRAAMWYVVGDTRTLEEIIYNRPIRFALHKRGYK